MTQIIHAELAVTDCDARFLVNDIPVGALRHRRSVYSAVPIHEYLVKGLNTLKIIRSDTPPPKEEGAQDADAAAASARLTIAAYAPGTTPGNDPGAVAAVLDYKAVDAAGKPVTQAESSVNLPQLPFAWSWQALPVVDWVNPRAVSVVYTFLKEFSARFQSGDANWIMAALLPKMTDYCNAYSMDLRSEIAELQGRMARRTADPTFAMTPFAEADLALRPCAGGKLADCVIKSGEPVIRWRDARAGVNGAMMLRVG